MYRMDNYLYGASEPSIYWNIDRPFGPGDVGPDVQLIQYLLNYYELQSLPALQTQLIEVDGIWGPATSAAVTRLEGDTTYWTIHDGLVSPIPQNAVVVGTHFGLYYKLVVLHWIYAYTRSGLGSGQIDNDGYNSVVLDMPENYDCPPMLGSALRAARGY